MALDTISYDILPYTREFDDLANLYYFERLVVEADTDDTSVTPTVHYSGTSTALTAFSCTDRAFNEITVNKLGPISQITFTPINEIYWYGIEMFIRPLEMGVQLVSTGRGPQRKFLASMPGRSSDVTTSIQFDINPFSFPEDSRHINPVLRYLWLDIETGAETITPTLVNDQGTETALTGITSATRGIQEFSILATNRIKTVRLDGDFSSSDVILYDIEVDLYIPNSRRMSVG